MLFLGIDPGYAITGWGVLSFDGYRFKAIDYGAVLTNSGTPFQKRLKVIYDEINLIIQKYNPVAVGIEELFFNTNVKTAILVGQARGAIVVAIENNNKQLEEFTPIQIKQGVTGYGRADKNQIIQMVKMLLNLEHAPKLDDTADGLAIAICTAHSYYSKRLINKQ